MVHSTLCLGGCYWYCSFWYHWLPPNLHLPILGWGFNSHRDSPVPAFLSCVSEVTRGMNRIYFRRLAVLTTTKSDGSRDVDRMFVPASTLERQKDRETKGLQLSEMVARPRLGIRSQQKLGAEWNECRYFNLMTPICLVYCVVRISPCFQSSTLCSHPQLLLWAWWSSKPRPRYYRQILFRPFLSILSWASIHSKVWVDLASISDITFRQIVPYSFSERAKRVLLGFQIPHGVGRGCICLIDKYCSQSSLSRKKSAISLHNIYFILNKEYKCSYLNMARSIFSLEAYGILAKFFSGKIF